MRRIVDQDVEAAQLRHRDFDDFAAMRRALDVARQQHAFASGLFHQPLGLTGVVIFVIVAHQNVGTLARERQRHGASDAAIGSGNDRLFARKASGAFVGGFAIVGRRVHRCAAPGR